MIDPEDHGCLRERAEVPLRLRAASAVAGAALVCLALSGCATLFNAAIGENGICDLGSTGDVGHCIDAAYSADCHDSHFDAESHGCTGSQCEFHSYPTKGGSVWKACGAPGLDETPGVFGAGVGRSADRFLAASHLGAHAK